jgi:hypothetical protein
VLGPGIGTIATGGNPRHVSAFRQALDAPAHQETPVTTIGKTIVELTELANAALRDQPGCATAIVPGLHALPDVRGGRNWEIPNVILGDSLISDVDRAVLTVHHQLGRKFHLLTDH